MKNKAEIVQQELERVYKDNKELMYRSCYELTKEEAKLVLNNLNLRYNDFTPEVLNQFPDSALFILAREHSFCMYVKGKNLPKTDAQEVDQKGDYVRYWWD